MEEVSLAGDVNKPFLGGYRHTVTGVEYHHASTQTLPPKKTPEQIEKMNRLKHHREAQTRYIKTRSQQTYREQGTQMNKPGLILDESDSVEVPVPEHYFDSEMMEQLRIEKAVVIQAWTRGCFARRLARKLKNEKQQRLMEKDKSALDRMEKEEEKKRTEIERRMHPKSKEDFDILFNQLESWRLAKIDDIHSSSMLSENEKKTALIELLNKETKLLQTIDRLKQAANEESKHENIHNRLKKMADPKTLANPDGGTTYIETPFTVRARELMDLYHGLNTEMLSVDERLDVLLHVKWTVKEFDCRLTRDIVELIDREADLLNRGRKDKSLVGLRKRLSNLFLEFIEEPEFNPEAIQFVRK